MKKTLSLAAIVLVFLFAVSLVSLALAAEVRGPQEAQVKAGEVINDDVYITGTAVDIAGVVNGDVMAAGNSVTVSGRINGNLFAAAQNVTVSGKVDGGIFAAGQTVILSGEVPRTARVAAQTLLVRGQIGRDLVAAGQSITIENGGTVGQDLLLTAQEGHILGSVGRRLQGALNSLTIAGKVGDVSVEAERLSLEPGASVGALTYTSEQEARIHTEATVSGQVTHLLPEPKPASRPEVRVLTWTDQIVPRLWWFVSTLVVGMVAALLLPAILREPTQALRDKPWHSLGWGALVFVVTPIAVIVSMVTVVGIPLGLLVLFGYGVALFISQVFVGLLLGQLILQQKPGEGTVPLLGPLALGLAVLAVVFALTGAVDFLGGLVVLATLVFGLGAAWIAVGRARSGQKGQPEMA